MRLDLANSASLILRIPTLLSASGLGRHHHDDKASNPSAAHHLYHCRENDFGMHVFLVLRLHTILGDWRGAGTAAVQSPPILYTEIIPRHFQARVREDVAAIWPTASMAR